MRIQYKLMFIIGLFFGIIVFSNSNCLAYTYEGQEIPELPENIHNSQYTYIFRNEKGNLLLFYVDKPMIFYTHKDLIQNYKLIWTIGNETYCLRYGLKPNDTSWGKIADTYNSSIKFYGFSYYLTLIYSNSPLYVTNFCSALGVFLTDINDPLMQPISANDNIENYYKYYVGDYEGQQIPFTSSLFYIAKENTLKSVLNEIVGLLPIVIVVIVAFIAVRKGISFLRSALHSA